MFTPEDLPSVNRLLPLLKGVRRDAQDPATGGEIDVRIQVLGPEDWFFRTGDASYDTSHHGYWGAGTVAHDDTDDTLLEIAQDLIEQVLSEAAD